MTASADEAEFERVLQWLADETGLVFRPDQFRHTVGVIRRLMDSFGVSDSAKILSTLQSRREVVAELINQLTVGETYFFREPRHFHFIQSHILPEVQSRRSASHRFRAWSAGCASGEEAYSLAIVCHRRGFASSVDIMATDLSREALDRARRGVFRPWSFRGDAAREVAAYATKEGEQFFLHDDVKRMVRFQELNLASEAYPSPINGTTDVDLIMCRNVLIYFSRQTVAEITKRLFGSLAKGGWLLTASGDPQLSDYADWEIVTNPDGMFYRKPLHSSQSVKPQSIQPRSAQPRSAQPRSAQPRSAQPRSAQPRSAQPRSARSGSQPRSAQPSTRPPTVKPGESADATRSATVQPASPQQPRFGQRERITATVNSNRVAAPDQSPFPVNGRRGTASDGGAIVSKASDAMEQGQYQRAVELTQPLADEPQACIVHVRALASTFEETGAEPRLLSAVDWINEQQKLVLQRKIEAHYEGNLNGLTIAVWGLAFKPKTDDIREAPALVLIRRLLDLGASVRVHDPEAMDNVQALFGDQLTYCCEPMSALDGADALAIPTEWQEFRTPDFTEMHARMKGAVIFDGRNLYSPDEVASAGFVYYSIGRPVAEPAGLYDAS